jgi:hypothetical protein
MRHARADRLYQQAHRLAGHGGKTFDAQHIETLGKRCDAR